MTGVSITLGGFTGIVSAARLSGWRSVAGRALKSSRFTPKHVAVAFAALWAGIALPGCSKSEESMPMRRLSDALSGPCFGVPIAFSEATQLQAYSCNDGSVAVEYPGLSRVVKDVFILDPIGLGIAGGHVHVFAFRPGGAGATASLIAMDTSIEGEIVNQIALPSGYSGASHAQIDAEGQCLLLARPSPAKRDIYDVALFQTNFDGRRLVVDGEPSLHFEADGFEVSGIGSPLARTMVCAKFGNAFVVVRSERYYSNNGSVMYKSVLQTKNGQHEIAKSNERLWPLNRNWGSRIALINKADGRMAIFNAETLDLSWDFNAPGYRWLSFDIKSNVGVAVKELDGSRQLLYIKREDGCNLIECNADTVVDDVGDDSFVMNVVASGPKFVVKVSRSDVNSDETVIHSYYAVAG